LCTDEYVKPTAENLENNFMHLTNYAINKNASKYVPSSGSVDAGVGSKRSLKVRVLALRGESKRERGGGPYAPGRESERERERGELRFFLILLLFLN